MALPSWHPAEEYVCTMSWHECVDDVLAPDPRPEIQGCRAEHRWSRREILIGGPASLEVGQDGLAHALDVVDVIFLLRPLVALHVEVAPIGLVDLAHATRPR